MTKNELARAYSPGVKNKTALQRLSRWMNNNPSLMEELKNNGYHTHQKILPPSCVKIIKKYLGEP